MENKINTYKGSINEFTDWVSGINSITETNVTDNLPVSGSSIRQLIQDKLKVPFVMYEDIENSLYRMFSSTTARDLWLSDKDTYSKLELFNFTRPSAYTMESSISSDPRYMMSGDSEQSTSKLTFNWYVKNNSGTLDTESLTATYTITDKDGNVTSFSRMYSSSTSKTGITIDLYDYLKTGLNTISVLLKGTTTGAVSGSTYTITVLTLNLTSTFDFNARHELSMALTIPYKLIRNVVNQQMSILFYIDGNLAGTTTIPSTKTATEISDSMFLTSDSLSISGQHTLQIFAQFVYDTSTFKSNLLYYTFNVATDSTELDYFINVSNSFNTVNLSKLPISEFTLSGTQYQPITLNWGYYTDNMQIDTTANVTWSLVQDGVSTNLGTITAPFKEQAKSLKFIPSIYTTDNKPITLVASYTTSKSGVKTFVIPISIAQSTLSMYETPNYVLKLSAYGKTNSSEDAKTWVDTVHNINTTFTNSISFDDNLGWYNNGFRVSGIGNYATINYNPLAGNPSNGRTIEFEFQTEKVNNTNDVIMMFGDATGGHISITPNSATIYDSSNNDILHTNFKSNERLKLAFIINNSSTSDESDLIYIVNNGILERAINAKGIIFTNNTGKITIGNSESGIILYNIRVYNRAISYTDAYNNYVYDSENKSTIIANNDVLLNGEINFDQCANKLDTILIQGDLSKILSSTTDKENSLSDVTIQRICPDDSTKNFTITGGQIRKHGQSTLNYPITSMKFWSNKSVSGTIPTFTCASQTSLGLNKSRYLMKNTSIPANKWILQANYADSSGVHNGGLERLMQDTWYNAVIDGEYKLRTAPQLFASSKTVTHNNVKLNEDGTWYNIDKTISQDGLNSENKQWSNYFSTDFPYTIRISPDSFPCTVFYQDTAGSNTKTFLGQYVFMEDKGADFCYGERSIYKASSKDPFCLTTLHAKDDTDTNLIWDNKNVLRIEVTSVNSLFTSYLSDTDFTKVINDATTGQPSKYNWEQYFEMICPDPDDLTGNTTKGTDKFGVNSKFVKTAQPFVDWFKWVVSTKDNPTKFQAEASQHLDLYKMAAYYIFMLRFALVDSGERNVQIKTYDGIHFHYGPWDMDIASGDKNTGGIAFDPPVDRNTTLPGDSTTYAISGRNGLKGSSNYTSNWLWDALEGWDYWINTIVPKVAQALYIAGLSYDNIIAMFDDNYQGKWCEIIYNNSGYFKYVESGKGSNSWLNWLQGARTTHRHWWLSTSMDYYDAKWNCGDYKNHGIYFAMNHTSTDNKDIITIIPSSDTYFTAVLDDAIIGTQYATKASPAKFDISKITMQTKNPFHIYGATYIQDIDLSCVAANIDSGNIAGAYSSVLGSSIKTFNIGCPIIQGSDSNTYTSTVSGMTSLNIAATDASGNDALENVQTVNIRGQQPMTSFSEYYDLNRQQVTNVYAMGSGLKNFYSSQTGNKYTNLELPEINYLELHNSTWQNLTFWKTVVGDNNLATITKCNINSDYSLNIPSSLKSVSLLGTTGATKNSKDFVLNWIKCLNASGTDISGMTLLMNGIYWDKNSCGESNLLTYDELAEIAKFNNGLNKVSDAKGINGGAALKGYIMLDGTSELTAQQLTQIKAWFGDTVFTKSSAGLIIDQAKDYIQINVGGNDITITNGEIYLKEGKKASLNATKFSLGEDTSEYNWFMRAPGSTNTSNPYNGTSIVQGSDGIWYLQPAESNYGDYDVEILCTSTESSLSTTITVHIVGVTYPTGYTFNKSNNNLRTYSTNYVFPATNINSEFYVTADSTFDATLENIFFTLKNSSNESLINYQSYKNYTGGSSTPIAIGTYLSYMTNASNKYSLPLNCILVSDIIQTYSLTAYAQFKSGKIIQTSATIMVLNDNTPILQNDGSLLYQIVTQKYISQFNTSLSNYYKTHLMALIGTLDFTTDPVTNTAKSDWLAITSIKANSGSTILKYLPNITGLVFDNCTALTSTNSSITDDDKNQFVFTYMPNLVSISMQNCIGLTNDIDVSSLTKLTTLNLGGTTINAILPTNSVISTLHLGSPTQISINTPTALLPAGITIDSSTNIDSVNLTQINTTENKTFNTFAKLINYETFIYKTK